MTTEETAMPAVSAEPGLLGSGSAVVDNLPHNEYLAMPALSVSGMKQLLPPSCPALFDYWRKHRRPSKPAYDFGHVVHNLVLGEGPEFTPVPFADWRTKAAQAMRKEAYETDRVPLLWEDFGKAFAAASAVRANRVADALLSNGKPEQTLTWTDKSGVPMRARVDWLPNRRKGRRFVVVDLKTTGKSAHPKKFAKEAADYLYFMQAAQYLEGVKACGLDDNPAFVLVVVETAPPHLVSLVQFTEEDLQIGRDKIRDAVAIYQRCTETGIWPGYSPDIETIELPAWFRREHERELDEEEVA